MTQTLTLKFMDGEHVDATLAEPFDPKCNAIEVYLAGTDLQLTYPLPDLCYVCFLTTEQTNMPPIGKADTSGEVETTTDECFHVRFRQEPLFTTGFFARPVEPDGPCQAFFFCTHGVRERRDKKRLLGDILEDQGLVSPTEMQDALKEQERLRNRRVGEILAEQNNLPQETIDKTVNTAIEKGINPAKARIGDILVSAGLVTRDQVEQAMSSQKEGKKKRIGELLIDLGLITEEQLLSALAEKFRMRYLDLTQFAPTPPALQAMNVEMARRLKVLPIDLVNDTLIVATSSPTDPTLPDTLRFNTNCRIELAVASSAQIAEAIEEHYVQSEDNVQALIGEMSEEIVTVEEEVEDNKFSESDSQIIRLVNNVLLDAFQKGVSDLHFEPGGGNAPFTIRYRIDGICRIAHKISATYKHAILSRLKIMARLDIAERRRPQSGKILIRAQDRNIEFRLEITPTVGGQEDAVLRLLSGATALPLEVMGFSDSNLRNFKEIIAKPYGVVLCVGPTGSGKTTTLHSALAQINTPERKIWTAEDPVEITQAGLRQVQVNAKIGFTFQNAMRSFLRADPDVIMIGEMRDPETAKTAIEASLTGHLVFSTLHTNSAPETVVRLIEMGMDPVNFAEAMLGVLAQRLARKLCSECKQQYHPSREEYDELVRQYGPEWFKAHGLPEYTDELSLMRKIGCGQCEDTGYSGRVGIHELLVGTENLKKGIKKELPADELKDLGLQDGMATLKMDGIRKIFNGVTDIDQILRVCL